MSLTISAPNGKTYTTAGTTDTNGLAYFQHRLNAAAPKGVYNASALATASFTVS